MKEHKGGPAVLGVDLGGTKINVGRVMGATITATASQLIPAAENAETVLQTVLQTISTVFDESVVGIGIGIPSVLDREHGIIYDVQNIPSWKKVPLKMLLEKQFNVPVFIDNDANCFAIGEKLFGKGQAYDNFVGVTLGTGLGTGIINRGSLLCDANCGSGEFGEMPYLDGKLEEYASGQFFVHKLKEDGLRLFQKAQAGDAAALNVYRQFGTHLGVALKMMLYALDPGHIILGGSIIAARSYFEASMYEELQHFAYPMSLKTLTIDYAEHAADAPVLGAAAVCVDALAQRGIEVRFTSTK